jgi:hypothetical protein
MVGTSKKLKIWTLITHALIIIGAGHGGAWLLIFEIAYFPYVTKENFSFAQSSDNNHFPVVGLVSLIGQAAIICSMLSLNKMARNVLQQTGIVLLWVAVLYIIYDTKDSYIYLMHISVIPFGICSLITWFGLSLKRLYVWILD